MTPQEALAAALWKSDAIWQFGHPKKMEPQERFRRMSVSLAAALTEAGMSIVPTAELERLRRAARAGAMARSIALSGEQWSEQAETEFRASRETQP